MLAFDFANILISRLPLDLVMLIYIASVCEMCQSKRLDEAEELYEKAVAQFPTTGRYWKIYIEHEVFRLFF
jgi:hypothetical protein